MSNGINSRSRWEIILDILEVIAKAETFVLARSRSFEIILDILEVTAKEGNRAKKTRIMKKAYLDWRNFHRHFDFLKEVGFIEEIDDVSGGTLYKLTDRGKDLRGKLKDVGTFLQ
jgi:predicted transcriptional regulator